MIDAVTDKIGFNTFEVIDATPISSGTVVDDCICTPGIVIAVLPAFDDTTSELLPTSLTPYTCRELKDEISHFSIFSFGKAICFGH